MNTAYVFTFFLFVLLVLFILLPFMRKKPEDLPRQPLLPENTPLDDDEFGASNPREQTTISHDRISAEIEAEVAVARIRLQKSTFGQCSKCGRKMNAQDRFCASCGTAYHHETH